MRRLRPHARGLAEMLPYRSHLGMLAAFCGFMVFFAHVPVGAQVADDPPPAEPWPAHPSRLIVKYSSRASECGQCVLARGQRFATFTKTDSLDRLHARFHVKEAKGLFLEQHGSGPERSAAMRRAADRVRARFPVRAARAPRGAASPDLSNVFVLELGTGVDVVAAARAFSADPDVEYAEPDYIMRATYVPNDPFFSSSGSVRSGMPDLWGLHAMQASDAWDIATGAGIVVAIVDTGIKHRHPDIRDTLWVNPGEIDRNRIDDDGNGFVDDTWGWNFVRNRRRPRDRNGHGTHVAGTVAATGDNLMGVVGLSFGARVMSLAGLDGRGQGYTSDLAKCIAYAADNGADVINNSWGGPMSYSVREAVEAAKALGAVVVFSAGNNDSTYLGQAGDPNVIAVAAVEYGDTRASFSNYGKGISVAAPGVDVLSLSGPRRVGGFKVERRYRVLSGTSMAAPHASGAIALLLQNQPTLTTDEVRWHLELNADQPGYPGYEGEAWNPMLGWGRINAARIFDPPPVTTRLKSDPIALHTLVDSAVTDTASIEFEFTTHDPVAWSVTSPPWLIPDAASGSGPSSVSFDVDATGLTLGTYAGSVDVLAPAAVDGGAGTEAELAIHAEHRTGAQIVIDDPYDPWSKPPSVAVASDGSGVFAAWVEWMTGTGEPTGIQGAYVDDSGTVTGPFQIHTGIVDFWASKIYDLDIALAFDGTNFLVVWIEEMEQWVSETSLKTNNYTRVKALRVTAGGTVLDPAPVELGLMVETENRIGGFDKGWGNLRVGFDGTSHTVIWRLLDFGSSRLPIAIYMTRLSVDGTPLSEPEQIYPVDSTVRYQAIAPKLACRAGTCLVAWVGADGETTPLGKYIHKVYGQRWNGSTLIDAEPYRLLTDLNGLSAVTASEHGWFLSGYRYVRPAEDLSGYVVIGARIATDGTPLDIDGIRLDVGPSEGVPSIGTPASTIFDGQNYLVRWNLPGPVHTAPLYYPFAARVAPDGTVLDSDDPGLLLAPQPLFGGGDGVLAQTATKSLLVWIEPFEGAAGRILAQGVFER